MTTRRNLVKRVTLDVLDQGEMPSRLPSRRDRLANDARRKNGHRLAGRIAFSSLPALVDVEHPRPIRPDVRN
jgi:hypothetical protein